MSLFSSLAGGDDIPMPPSLKGVDTSTKLDRPRDFICCLSSNKDTYKPGNVVRCKAILLNAVTGEPDIIYKLFEKEKDKVDIMAKIIGPSGSDVMNEAILQVPNKSVVSFDWEIPQAQAGGEYTIEMYCKPKNKASVYPFFPKAKRLINVQVYRPPRFKMDLEFVRKAYGEGDKCRAVLKVRRAEGAFPTSATVEATCRLDGVEIYRGDYKINPKNGICNVEFDLPKEIKEGIGSLTCAVTEGATESISKTLPIILKRIKCNVYPEGGQLVQGLSCGCYFETFNTSGDPAELWGMLIQEKDGEKKEVVEVKTYHEGRGVFTFTPEEGCKYSIRVDKPSGVVFPVELPEIKKFGVSLVLKEKKTLNGNEVEMEVGSTEDLSVVVGVFRKDVQISTKQLQLKANEMQKFKMNTLKYDGVLRATVFYSNFKYNVVGTDYPLAERLFMIHPKDEIIYDIRRTKSEYRPGEKCTLWITPKLKSTGESIKSYLSLTVTDDSVRKMTEKRKRPPRLFSQYYLEPEVKEINDHQRYITPQIVETELEKKIKSYVCTDLLLGVQGWRRYVYKNYKANPTDFYKQMDEDLKEEYFKVLNKAPKISQDVALPPEIPEMEGDELLFQNGTNKMVFPYAPGTWQCVKANVIDEERFEFSVKVNYLDRGGNQFGLMIGVSQKNHSATRHLGYNKSGWAYIAGNGKKNFSSSNGTRYGAKYGTGDIITCIVDYKKRTLEFKKNLVSQGIAYKNVKTGVGTLYIAIAVCAAACDVELLNEKVTPEMVQRVVELAKRKDQAKRHKLESLLLEKEERRFGGRRNYSSRGGRRGRGRGRSINRAPPRRAMKVKKKKLKKSGKVSMTKSSMTAPRMAPKMKSPKKSPMRKKKKKGKKMERKEKEKSMKMEMEQEQPSMFLDLAGEQMIQSSMRPSTAPQKSMEKKKMHFARKSRRKREYISDESDDEDFDEDFYIPPPLSQQLVPDVTVKPYSVVYYHKTQKNRSPNAERNDFEETLLWDPIKMTRKRKNKKGIVKQQLVVDFDLCDSVSSFRVLVDGFTRNGVLGQQYNHVVKVVKPFYVEPKIPLEICFKDIIKIPIACVNNMDEDVTADLTIDTDFTKFNLSGNKFEVKIPAKKRVVQYVDLQVKNSIISENIPFVVDAIVPKFRLTDKVRKEITVKGYGFPQYWSFSGMFAGSLKKEEFLFKIPITLIPGTLQTYSFCSPSPAANLTQAMKGLIRRPSGCFEQVASTLYPMVMANIYFSEKGVDLGVAELKRLESNIDAGYKKLKGYQVKSGACDWYGSSPGNESLTAMGINLFTQLERVWPVSQKLIKKCVKWLISRKKDDNSGFKKHSGRYGYGYAPEDTTNAYILWAISNCAAYVNFNDIKKVIDFYVKKVESLFRTPDCYVMALLCLALTNFDQDDISLKLAKEILKLQEKDGSFQGKSSICRSYGSNLSIETTALCTMALMGFESETEFQQPIVKSISWIMKKNSYGRFGSTQGTCLAIQALVQYYSFSEDSDREEKENVKLSLNKMQLEQIDIPPTAKESLFFKDFSESIGLREQENSLVVETNLSRKLPYSVNVACKITKPIVDFSQLDFTFSNSLAQTKIKEGDSTEIEVSITNKKNEGLPMIIAIIALPGGLEVRVPKLKELRKQEVFDFYEMFGARNIVFYWRGMKPKAEIKFKFDVLAQVPGTYTGECSSCYLYYNDDIKWYENALECEIATK